MNKPFFIIDAEHFKIKAFEIKPLIGYELPINKDTNQSLPNCCEYHKSVNVATKKWFKLFPNCCEHDKIYNNNKWFKKESYNYVPEKIVRQLSYTEHCIKEKINLTNWFKEITDYIEYNVLSFGQPAIGLHQYLEPLKHYIDNSNLEISKEKRQKLVEFIDAYYKVILNDNNTDLNELYNTYKAWLNFFPFEITSYFGDLKNYFDMQLPLAVNVSEINIYTGIAKAKIHTQSSLIDALMNLTNELITQLNSYTLNERGLISDINKIKLELLNSSRKAKIKQGYNNTNENNNPYKSIINEWFEDEKTYLTELQLLLINKDAETSAIKPTPTVNEIKEPDNKYPKVFKNGYAYQMFIELKNLTVDKNHLADYGFIFQKLTKKDLRAINETIKANYFIKFLKKEFDADISATKFPPKDQQSKQQTYNTILAKYKANIID